MNPTDTTTTNTTAIIATATTGAAMIDAADQLGEIAEMIERGAVRGARARLARLLDTTDPATRLLLVRCVEALEAEHPTTTLARLRREWRQADADGRALVEACAPSAERRAEKTRDAERTARANRAKDQAHAARKPGTMTTRRSAPRGRRDPRAADGDTVARRYFADRIDPGADTDEPARDDRLDYDLAAVPPMRGLPCVACGVERSATDQRRAVNDGLCQDCREDGTLGIAVQADGATRQAILTARCDYIAATSTSPAERDARMRRDWRGMTTADKFAVIAWRDAQPT
ncbi:hypothetical protein [Pseudonocardia sp. TMWB2A]|uniref:hypothetical protein n=1 Tax=Pseudonocardia sp. TMWB2A TaxID=687430 RepID=UPI00307F6B20